MQLWLDGITKKESALKQILPLVVQNFAQLVGKYPSVGNLIEMRGKPLQHHFDTGHRILDTIGTRRLHVCIA